MREHRHQSGQGEKVNKADADWRLRLSPALPQIGVLAEVDRVLLRLRPEIAKEIRQPELFQQRLVEVSFGQREGAPVAVDLQLAEIWITHRVMDELVVGR